LDCRSIASWRASDVWFDISLRSFICAAAVEAPVNRLRSLRNAFRCCACWAGMAAIAIARRLSRL
jgi:hypothetical protein